MEHINNGWKLTWKIEVQYFQQNWFYWTLNFITFHNIYREKQELKITKFLFCYYGLC